MVTIMINRDVKSLLDEYKNDKESTDDAVNRLLDEVDSDLKMQEYKKGSININISRESMARIKSYKIRDDEPYGRILFRALLLSDIFK